MSAKALLAFGLVCASAAGSEADPSAPAKAPTNDPWGNTTSSPAKPPLTREQRADAALARVASIMPKLATIRELAFAHDIPRKLQSAADFRAFLHTDIAKDMPPAKAADDSAALFHIGLLTKAGNLAELEEQAFATQAGAYYDPAAKKFFLVMVPNSDLMLDTISAHELTHGLQDQHFDLEKYLKAGANIDEDHESARHFVAEGDATFTMFLYAIAQFGLAKPTPAMMAMLHSQLTTFANMTPDEIVKANAAGFGDSIDPDIKKSIDAMGDIPQTVLIPMIDWYLKGALLAETAYGRDGWKGVNALFTDPPESTEQVLHPTTKLYPTREHPKRVTFAVPDKSAHEIANIVFGELQWQIYFQLWLPAQKAIASEGWGGDRAIVTRDGSGKLVAWIATAWDTAKDADEFAAAYDASLPHRFAHGAGDPATPAGFDRGDQAGKIFLRKTGSTVVIVDGAADAKALDHLAAAVKVN